MDTSRHQAGGDFVEAIASAMDGRQAEMWTALPAVLESFDAGKRTCTVQPTIRMLFTDESKNETWLIMPQLLDVPVMFPGGGGFVLTFPLKYGDEGLVVFGARCIDAWWQSGPGANHDGQVQAEMRMHDLSDGFFIPTVRSVPNVEAGISTSDVELRSVDPSGPVVSLKPDGSASVYSPVAINIDSPIVNITGNAVTVTATTIALNGFINANAGTGGQVNLVGVVMINGEAYTLHRHTSVQSGSSNTGPKA